VERVRVRAESDARAHGYYLNPDPASLHTLLEGLQRNEERYGYPSCPCRLASGAFEVDRDIICPCDYRDPDVQEYGYCFCAFYVRKDVSEGETPITPIPERRPSAKQARIYDVAAETTNDKPVNGPVTAPLTNTLNLWYCKRGIANNVGTSAFEKTHHIFVPYAKQKKRCLHPYP
jgi:ferredoxin-thioredoxin reductase catalytic subunit